MSEVEKILESGMSNGVLTITNEMLERIVEIETGKKPKLGNKPLKIKNGKRLI